MKYRRNPRLVEPGQEQHVAATGCVTGVYLTTRQDVKGRSRQQSRISGLLSPSFTAPIRGVIVLDLLCVWTVHHLGVVHDGVIFYRACGFEIEQMVGSF